MSSEKKPGFPFRGWAFCVVLSIAVVLADRSMGAEILRQWRTADHAETQGTVGTHFITQDWVGRDKRPVLTLGYNYTVDGQAYTSTRIGHGIRLESGDAVKEIANRFALNASVPVYYAPEDPSQAVLLQGLQGYSLIHLAWLFVLHLALLGAWYSLVQSYRWRGEGMGATVVAGRTQVPLSLGLDGWMALGVGTLVASGLLYLAESLPSLSTMGVFWAGVMAAAVIVALRRGAQKRAGAFDLILDERNGRVSAPPLERGAKGLDWPVSQLRGSRLEQHVRLGAHNAQVTSWKVLLSRENNRGEWQESVVANLESRERAEHLSAWLNRLGTPSPQRPPAPVVAQAIAPSPIPLPMAARAPVPPSPNSAPLGPLRFVKRTSIVNIIYGPIFGLAIVALGVHLLYKPGFVSSGPGYNYWWYDFPLGLIVLSAGLFVFWLAVQLGRIRTFVHQDGILHRDLKGEVRIHFQDLKSFNYAATQEGEGVPLNIYVMNFEDEQGRRAGFQVQPDGFKDKDLPVLRDELAERVANKLEAQLDSGVPWLPGVELRRDGLYFPGSGQPPLRFSPSLSISIENGVCTLEQPGTSTYSVPTGVFNFYPVLLLIQRAVRRDLAARASLRS